MRHDGWTAERRSAFLRTLRMVGAVREACRAAGMSGTAAYRLRKRDAEFAADWASAQKMAAADLELVLYQRAVEGVPERVIQYGKDMGVRVKRSDALLRLLLQASDPERFGRTGRGGETAKQIEARVRAEVLASLPRRRTLDEVRGSIVAKLEAIENHDRAEKLALGWREGGPDGRLLPPGYRLIRYAEAPVPYGWEAAEVEEDGAGQVADAASGPRTRCL